MLQELRVKESNYRILRRRVVWLLGRWIGVKLSVDLRPLIYETVLGLMEPGEDLVIRLTSAVTLRSALDDFEFNAEQFLPFLERSFSLLFTLLKEAEECETKVSGRVFISGTYFFNQSFYDFTDECLECDVSVD